ncbi:MAG: hypothetical protein Q9160_009012 [Pyrenula sp. 1 TL-2023]
MAVYNNIDPLEDESHQIISSYFLGPKAENYKIFKKCLVEILESQRDARLDYFPKDGKFITEGTQASAAYRQSVRKMINATRQASHLLGKHSIPFCIEASPFTTVAEIEVGEQFCNLFGYNVDPNDESQPTAWGHIVCDGTVANLESMWVARNLKFYPLSIRSAMDEDGPLAFAANNFDIEICTGTKKLFKDLDKWELLNLRPSTILDIPERLYAQFSISPGFLDSVINKYGIQSTSKGVLEKEFDVPDMNYYIANTRHYSWPKAGAVTGIGSDHIIGVKVDHGARVDVDALRANLQESLNQKTPVYAVTAIIGSTEEGAVDPLRDILELRREYQAKGLSFVIHADAAWGSYFRSMIPQDYKPGDEIKLPSERGTGDGFVPDSPLRINTQEDLFMLREADSITIDPHKAGYVPYPAGGLCYRDGRMRYQVTWTSPYISRGEKTATSIGIFGIEGSKPGASVMSTWFSNACIGLGPDGYGRLLGEVTFTCSRISAEWAAMSEKEDDFIVVPLNELPSELKDDTVPEKVEEERQKIRDRVLKKTNEQIVSEDESRPEGDKALALLRALGSDLNINAFSTNWKYANGEPNTEVEEANYFNTRVIQRLSVDSPEDDPTQIPLYLTSTTFQIPEYGECAQHFKKRLGLFQDQVDLVVMRNVVMSPWPTDGNFIAQLVDEFRKVCRQRNDTSPTEHQFLLQGTDKVYLIHIPMFHLEKHRHQLIIEVELADDVRKIYVDAKKQQPAAVFELNTIDKLDLASLVAEKKPFEASISKRGEGNSNTTIIPNLTVCPVNIIKDKSLKGRFRDTAYPTNAVPFYLYGTPHSLNIDHILTRSPNIQLSAEDIELSLTTSLSVSASFTSGLSASLTSGHLPTAALANGAILTIDGISEAAMQPFQPIMEPLNGTTDSTFFFRPGQQFNVTVYEDSKKWNEPGPGLLEGLASSSSQGGPKAKVLGKGTMKLREGRYVDSVAINKDPFEQLEGDEKYKAWKKVFDSIGKELA